MGGIKITQSPQNERGESSGAVIVDAGPVLSQQLERDGEELFHSELDGKTYVLSEKKRRLAQKKTAKQDSEVARQLYVQQQLKLEPDGTLKPTKIEKPGEAQPRGKSAVAMLESQQTVLTATAKKHGLKANTHQGAVHALKEEKSQIKHEKADEKKEKRKHAKAEEKKRERAKGHEVQKL